MGASESHCGSGVFAHTVLDDLRRKFVLTHRCDYVVGEPRAFADLVDALHYRPVKCRILQGVGMFKPQRVS